MSRSRVVAGMKLAAEAIMGSVAPKTWEGYSASWRKWLWFASSSGYNGSRPTEGGLLAFTASLMMDGFSCSYLVKSLAGISFFCRLKGLPSCMSYFFVKRAIKGYKRRATVADGRKFPWKCWPICALQLQ